MAHIGRGGLVEVECLDGALAVVAGEVLQTALGTRAASYNQPETMMHISVANDPQSQFTVTEKAPTRAFSQLKAPTCSFTFKTLCGTW